MEQENDARSNSSERPPQDVYKNPQLVQTKVPPVTDKSTNHVQITAEMILKDPQLHVMGEFVIPMTRIMDEHELREYKATKRKEFEDKIRKQKHHMGTWIKYALWEEALQEYARSRSIFERALDIDYTNVSVWLKYSEMEMRNKFINHARNVWERATMYLPRVDQFWFKYIYMEEMLGYYLKARKIFDKWMSWKPGEKAWISYVRFEERMGEHENCRKVMYKYLDAHPKLDTYLKVARYESKNRHFEDARFLFERALEDLGDECFKESFFIQWAKFEMRLREFERAREIFKFGLECVGENNGKRLYEEYLKLEKQFGSNQQIDDLIHNKRRIYYNGILKENPRNYDVWFDLIFMEQTSGNINKARETFERAVSNPPPAKEKRFWKRYIYLWISYAAFEELKASEPTRTEKVYQNAIKLIPHKIFTFSKLWVMFSQFYIRQKDITSARRVLGTAIGLCPRESIFKAYIQLEMQLTNFDRCRTLYSKYLESFPDNPSAWISFARMELGLEELERARQIFEAAIILPALDMPEAVWKAYIDAELSLGEQERARLIFKRLLQKTKHLKVWLSFTKFEKEQKNYKSMRKLYNEADNFFKGKDNFKEHRKLLIDAWVADEELIGDEAKIKEAKSKLPREVVRQRRIMIEGEVGETEEGHYEEYTDFIFPDDQINYKVPKLLLRANEWKKEIAGKEGTPQT